MLDGEPAIRTVARVGVNSEAELVNVERERLVLISNVQSDDFDALFHETSVGLGIPLYCPPPACASPKLRSSNSAAGSRAGNTPAGSRGCGKGPSVGNGLHWGSRPGCRGRSGQRCPGS